MTVVALLRGINLGPNNRIPMAELRTALGEAGFGGVATYLQSGNVILRELPAKLRGADDGKLAGAIEKVIADTFGFDIRVVVRTADELEAVLAKDPFAGVATDPAKYLVTFLEGTPKPLTLDPADYAPEQFALHGTEVYLWLPDGVHKAKLGKAKWERLAGVSGTARNWRTVQKLHALVAG
jgi:uncharacterized protein (DUF1697 family)